MTKPSSPTVADNLGRYYGNKPEYAALNVADMLGICRRTPTAPCSGIATSGFDRLLFHPSVASLDQVDRLADAVL